MIVTISGTAGSGKSTVGKILAKRLSAVRIYVGGIRRELAKEKGMSIKELNDYAKTHPETDVDVDIKASQEAKSLEKSGKIVIVEGRTQFHFLPASVKVFIKASLEVAAERIWHDLQKKESKEARNEGNINSLEEMKREILQRDEEDAKRYLKYYHIDHRREDNYDLVIDSSHKPAPAVAEEIINFINKDR